MAQTIIEAVLTRRLHNELNEMAYAIRPTMQVFDVEGRQSMMHAALLGPPISE